MIRPNTSNPMASLAPAEPFERKLFTRADYHRMIEAGVLTEDDRVELINGEIVTMTPVGPEHASITDKLTAFFVRKLSDRFICRNQGPQATNDVSEPEPDFQILKAREDYYKNDHPAPEDVLLVIEVAKSSLSRDRELKMRLYASAGICEYWVADLTRCVVIVHRDPNAEAAEYRSVKHYDASQQIAPLAMPDCALDLGWLFA